MSRREKIRRLMREARRRRRQARECRTPDPIHHSGAAADDGPGAVGMVFHRNDGGRIIESNYWDSANARGGFFHVSHNAGTFRLLVPESQEDQIPEMLTGRHAIVTLGFDLKARKPMYELMFEDDSGSPYALWLSLRQFDRAFGIEDAASRDREIIIYKRGCIEAGRMPVFFRQAETLPCLKPWTDNRD